jgi:predicted RND superfamily exporter protein
MRSSETSFFSVRHFAEFILRFRYLVLMASVVIVAACAMGLPKIKVTADYRVMFSEDYPQLIAFDAMQNIFGQRDNIMIVLAPEDGDVFSRETLEAVEWLTALAWKTPYSKRVDSLTNFQDTYATGDDLLVKPLVENAASLTDSDIRAARDIALNEPLMVDRIVASDASVTAVNITMHLPQAGSHEQGDAVAYVRDLMEQTQAKYPHLKTYLTGEIMMGQSFMEGGAMDAKTLFPIMFALILLITYFFLRSFWAVVGVTLVIILSVLSALGMSGYLQIEQSLMTGTAPVVILTLAVADSVHVLVTMFQEIRAGKTRHEAIIESLEVNMKPIFLTSLTTGIGFLSLNTSESPPFHALGNIVSMGIVFAFLFSVTSLPAYQPTSLPAYQPTGLVKFFPFKSQ